MAKVLPTFPEFDITETSTQAARWKKWLSRFQNLLVAMNVIDKKRQRALLLHYAGEAVNEIFDTLPDTTAGEGDDPLDKAVQALTNYFTPKQNREYEIYVFRQAKQENSESISAFHTRLRQLAVTCEFGDVDREIKTQIVQSCSSHKLLTKALENPSYTLAQLLDVGKAMELSKTQAANIEEKQSVNKLSSRDGNRRPWDRNNLNQDGGRPVDKKSRTRKSRNKSRENQKPSAKCYNCGGDYPHPRGKTSCPAYQTTCRSCGKSNHFEAVCRSKGNQESRNARHPVNKVSEEESSDEDEAYTFSLSTKTLNDQPLFRIKVHDTPVTIMADSGARINILDEKEYHRLTNRPKLEPSSVKIYGYRSKVPLRVLGKFHTTLESETKKLNAKLYVVEGCGGSLLSWKTSQELRLLQTIQQVKDLPSKPDTKGPADLIEEYDDLFHGLGKLKNYQVKLHIDEDVPRVAQPHRRVNFHVRKQLEEQLRRDEELGVIERIEGPTPWVSPIVVAPKPKSPGKVRVCVDMRQANKAVKRERHVTPTVREMIGDLTGSRVFSKLDLNQGYNQLELAPESRYITTFSTHMGLMRYKRLNFGISSAAEIFQNVIRETLEGIDGAMNISDDILVSGKTHEEHDQNLREVFQRLREKGLTLNKSKCEYSKDKLEFFGYVFSKDGISPDPKKVEDVVNLHTPSTASEVRSLLGMTNYCSRFIPDYATKTEPLRKLTHKDQTWCWTAEHDRAVSQLKDALVTAPVTAYFDPDKDTEISVDASPVGLAAILTQVDPKTDEKHVITYASRSLTATEQRYSQTEREGLAVVWACEHLHLYVYGKPVTIYTDHKPLVSIYDNPSSKPPARIERWALRLQPYQVTVKYRRGDINPADYLSRHPTKHAAETSRQQKVAEEYVSYLTTNSTPKALKTQDIEAATQSDATLQAVAEAITKGNWHDAVKRPRVDASDFRLLERVKDELTVSASGNLILRGTRIVIPKSLQEHVVNLAHEGHQGLVKTKSLLREKVWFPNIDKLVETKVKSCGACSVATPESKREPLQMSPLPAAPWKELSVDFAELPNKEYLLLITDDYSRYPVVEIVKSTSATTVIPKLDKVFSEFGVPDIVRSDNGPPFNSKDFASFADDLGFKHRKVTPKWARANGEVERFVRTVKEVVKTAKLEHKNYKQELNRLLRNYRATPHSTTRVAPATALFGRPMKTKLPEMSSPCSDPDIREGDRTAKAKMKSHADNKRYVKPSTLKEGDMVFVKRDDSKKKSDTPYDPRPRTVVEKKGSMVTAEDDDGVQITRNSSFFKSVPAAEEEKEENATTEQQEDSADVAAPLQPDSTPPRRYPQRLRRQPVKFDDYVCG